MDDWLPFSYTFLIHSFDFPLTFLWSEQKMDFFLERIIKNQEDFLFLI
jgi:hypothetical protein